MPVRLGARVIHLQKYSHLRQEMVLAREREALTPTLWAYHTAQ